METEFGGFGGLGWQVLTARQLTNAVTQSAIEQGTAALSCFALRFHLCVKCAHVHDNDKTLSKEVLVHVCVMRSDDFIARAFTYANMIVYWEIDCKIQCVHTPAINKACTR
eukprot:COSAG05_NODE_538_length_8854_cov_306.308738_15_plen_111_part_00